MASSITPFQIRVQDEDIQALKTKLSTATFPNDVSFADSWEYGVPSKDIKRLVKYWQDGFDWRKQEAKLNELSHFKTKITVDDFEELDIHFVHHRSSTANAIPLLFCHGWPGGYFEVSKLLPLLTNSKDAGVDFHVIAPSLPNYGFSQIVSKPGFGIAQYAEVCHKLMLQLGYDKYVTQGGDWGFSITRIMGRLYPDHVRASHINMIQAQPPSLTTSPWQYLRSLMPYSDFEKRTMERTEWFNKEGKGYNLLQSTRPHTLGIGLSDSPVALLAWVYEKLHDWTDSYPFTDDEILTWVSMYQFSTAGPAASLRIYYERQHGPDPDRVQVFKWNGRVPLGLSYFPKDIVLLPKSYGRTMGPVALEVEHDRGGHFAAFEVPELLAADLKKMFGKGGGAYSIAKELGDQPHI